MTFSCPPPPLLFNYNDIDTYLTNRCHADFQQMASGKCQSLAWNNQTKVQQKFCYSLKTYKSIYVFLKYNDTSYQIILKSFNSASKLCKFKRDGWLVKTMFFSQIELSPVYKEVSLYNTYIYFISILP